MKVGTTDYGLDVQAGGDVESDLTPEMGVSTPQQSLDGLLDVGLDEVSCHSSGRLRFCGGGFDVVPATAD